MKIHEYQAKQILKKYNVPVPEGQVVFSADEAVAASKRLPTDISVVKAQIHAGGRGKGGGVKIAKNPEEVKKESFVNKGIFKYTSNGMYLFGFLILWIPGLLLQSKAALIIALFNHIYIWVHYYFTEQPDIKIIYKK